MLLVGLSTFSLQHMLLVGSCVKTFNFFIAAHAAGGKLCSTCCWWEDVKVFVVEGFC
jgi:hypothetical protein